MASARNSTTRRLVQIVACTFAMAAAPGTWGNTNGICLIETLRDAWIRNLHLLDERTLNQLHIRRLSAIPGILPSDARLFVRAARGAFMDADKALTAVETVLADPRIRGGGDWLHFAVGVKGGHPDDLANMFFEILSVRRELGSLKPGEVIDLGGDLSQNSRIRRGFQSQKGFDIAILPPNSPRPRRLIEVTTIKKRVENYGDIRRAIAHGAEKVEGRNQSGTQRMVDIYLAWSLERPIDRTGYVTFTRGPKSQVIGKSHISKDIISRTLLPMGIVRDSLQFIDAIRIHSLDGEPLFEIRQIRPREWRAFFPDGTALTPDIPAMVR